MKLKDLYDLAVSKGIEHDPRGREEIGRVLYKAGKKFEELKEEEKQEFDREKLNNPYSDTRILFGDPKLEIKTILAGIDIEVGEILIADRLREKGRQIDLVLAHHPEGKALVGLYEVMHMQSEILESLGVPINVAQGIMSSRISEVRRGLLPLNHNKAVDAARMFEIPLMCVHTPADNMVTAFLQKAIEDKRPETVGDIIAILKGIPEYAEAVKIGAGPSVVVGEKERKCGRVFVDMTGGTGGSEDAFAKLSQAGVGTIVGMHIGEKHRKEAEKNHINVIIAGHMASDSLGMNLIIDEFAKNGIEIISCSGLTRFARI
ncbi:NGG1p interacting factor NIF3 [Phosphitispora sp. TUW77]|uniref:NGG1p interacting factor NIF3 n=1 Tax=Phosphitispora sp. TUW77 TaxID=3152361 RepID=UPI003AB9187D